jgi:cell division protein FtsI (penicillin-binding protein 3)
VPSDRPGRWRLLILGVALSLVWASVAVRLFDIQVVRAAELEEQGFDQRLRSVELSPRRGTIYDHDGRVLAFTIDGSSIYAHPHEVDDVMSTALGLAGVLGVPIADVEARLRSDSPFVWVERQVEPDVGDAVLALELPGVYAVDEPMRVYPAGSSVGHVVGFVDVDGNGIEGLEYHFDAQLRGRAGFLQYESSPSGVPILQGQTVEVAREPGTDLVTTIDLSLNVIAEQACADGVERTGAKRCSVVVLDPDTGAVLSLVVTPGLDPVDRSTLDTETLLSRMENMAIRSLYEPGSVMKLVTVSAALEEGVVSPDHAFEVPAFMEFEDPERPDDPWRFVDVNRHETEVMTVRDIVTRSSNIGTILIQRRLGVESQASYLEAFGFGAPTGIDYSGEPVGQVNVDPSCTTCGPSAAIGYAVNTTLLQMATAFAVVANGGEWVQPHLVGEVHGTDGVLEAEPERRRVLSEKTAATMRSLLLSVVESDRGTGRNAVVDGYLVGGKTGTSRVFDDGAYQEDRFMASFSGMAPIDDPRLVVAVLMEEPIEGYYGGQAAAPVFSEVMLKALHALGVEPDA